MSRAKLFCVINYKGGTGKTCTIVNIAHGMSKKGFKVLIVDTDPQGSTSYHFGINPKKTLYDVITKKATPEECIVIARENLDLIGANERLFPADHFMHQQKDRELILKNSLNSLRANYDYILMDCSPSINLMNQNALLFAENLLIPVSMEYMTLVGIKQLINNTKLLNKNFQSSIKISKIIPTFYNNRNKKTKHVYNSLERVFSKYLSHPIRVNISISEAAGHGKTIFEFDPTGLASEDYNKLTEEVLNYE